jgi:hypothetical protein
MVGVYQLEVEVLLFFLFLWFLVKIILLWLSCVF